MDPVTRGAGTQSDPFGWGIISTFHGWTTSGADGTLTANRAYSARWFGAGAITKIGLDVITQAGNIDVGSYLGGSGFVGPTTKKGSAGSTACPAAGYNELSLTASTTVTPGDYGAFAGDNAGTHIRIGGQGQAGNNLFKGQVYLQAGHWSSGLTTFSPTASTGFGPMLLGVP